jgi:signal transduction histidine kinase
MHLPGSIIAASVTAIWTFRLEQLNRQRQQAHLRRFQLISDMNHHIRNALQVISYHAFLQDGYTEHEHIRDAMNRIEWVLQEVLPQVNDAPQPAKQLVGRVEYRAS